MADLVGEHAGEFVGMFGHRDQIVGDDDGIVRQGEGVGERRVDDRDPDFVLHRHVGGEHQAIGEIVEDGGGFVAVVAIARERFDLRPGDVGDLILIVRRHARARSVRRPSARRRGKRGK